VEERLCERKGELKERREREEREREREGGREKE